MTQKNLTALVETNVQKLLFNYFFPLLYKTKQNKNVFGKQ